VRGKGGMGDPPGSPRYSHKPLRCQRFIVRQPCCSARMKVKNPSVLGRTVKCPKCGESFVAGAPAQASGDAYALGEAPTPVVPVPAADEGYSLVEPSAPATPVRPAPTPRPKISPEPASTSMTAKSKGPKAKPWKERPVLWHGGGAVLSVLVLV